MRGSPYRYDAEKKEFVPKPADRETRSVPSPVGEGLLVTAHGAGRRRAVRRRRLWLCCALLAVVWVVLVLAWGRDGPRVPVLQAWPRAGIPEAEMIEPLVK